MSTDELIRPDGKPLVTQPKVIVIKSERPLNQQFLQYISQTTKCAVIELPMECELIMGRMAVKSIDSIHTGIHAITQLPSVHFTNDEITIIYKALCFLCEHTQPPDNSPEIKIMKSLKMAVVDKAK